MPRRSSRQQVDIDWLDLRGRRTRAYIRESSPHQADADRYGPDTQRNGILALCREFSLEEPEHWYFDKASGRSVRGRTELQRALDEAPDYDVLLFFHTNRSFRDREDAAVWKPRLRRAGLTLAFAEQRFISGNLRTKTTEFLSEFIDEQRSDEQAMFIRSSLRAKFQRGRVNGSVPLGYQRHYAPPGDPERGRLVVEPRGRDTVRAIYDLYLTGTYSFSAIATRLNAERDDEGRPRHLSRQRRPLTPSGIREILNTRSYTGVTVWHPGTPEEEARQADHEPIVTPEEYERVQQIKSGRALKPGRAPVRDRVYPFSGRSACYDCGRTYVGDAGGKGGYLRMRHSFGECDAPSTIALSRLNNQMSQLLTQRFHLPEEWREQALALIAAPPREADPRLERRRTEIKQAMRKLTDLYLWSHIEPDVYQDRRRRLERELFGIERTMPAKQPVVEDNLARGAELLADIGALWLHPGVSDKMRKRFIEEAFEAVLFDELGIRSLTPTEAFRPLLAIAEVGGYCGTDSRLPLHRFNCEPMAR